MFSFQKPGHEVWVLEKNELTGFSLVPIE